MLGTKIFETNIKVTIIGDLTSVHSRAPGLGCGIGWTNQLLCYKCRMAWTEFNLSLDQRTQWP